MAVNAPNPWTRAERGFITARGFAPRLLTVKAVAARLALSRSSVYELIARGTISALRVGDSKRPRIRIDERELEAWLYGLAAASRFFQGWFRTTAAMSSFSPPSPAFPEVRP